MAACEDCSPQHIRNEGHDESAENKECKHQKRLLPEAVIGIAACFEEVASVENPGGLISSQENVNRLTRLHSPTNDRHRPSSRHRHRHSRYPVNPQGARADRVRSTPEQPSWSGRYRTRPSDQCLPAEPGWTLSRRAQLARRGIALCIPKRRRKLPWHAILQETWQRRSQPYEHYHTEQHEQRDARITWRGGGMLLL